MNKEDEMLFTDVVLFFLSIIVGFGIGFILGVLATETSLDVEVIGNMVCEEQGLGEFRAFDKENNIIDCARLPEERIKYDGGFIRVVD